MSTLRTNTIVDLEGGNTVSVNGALAVNTNSLRTELNASGAAPIYAARAWVNFNGTGTVAIRASGNVSSITDFGTGDYTVNFTTAMPDANYSVVGSCAFNYPGGTSFNTVSANYLTAYSTTACRIACGFSTTIADMSLVNVAVFR